MEPLDFLPNWAVYVGFLAMFLLAAEIGYRMGIWLQDRNPDADELRISGAVIGGMLGLLAFLTAFSSGIVINQHVGRKAVVVEEANAIGTAWLRAGFYEEPDLSTTRTLLEEYVKIRLAAAADPTQLPAVITRSEQIHGELWAIVEDNVKGGNESATMSIVAESTNDVIDIHTLRVTAAHLRLPRALGIVLIVTTLLSFLLLGIADSADRRRDSAAITLFALAIVTVLMLITDLDRPESGIITVSQQAMEDLLRQISPTGS